MSSEFFDKLVNEELAKSGRKTTEPVEYEYSIVLASNRLEKTGTAVTFVLKKEVDIDNVTGDALTASALSILDTENLNYADAILSSLKLTNVKPKPVTKRGRGRMFIGDSVTAKQGDLRTGIQLANGKFSSATNLRALLKLLTIKYVMQEMTSATTSGLHYRTGRLASSVDLYPIKISKKSPTHLSLFYTYMLYPYAVFDPHVSRRPELASEARNPQRLISEALLKAARDVIHSRYSLDIKQGK